jgi:hypothetical protein
LTKDIGEFNHHGGFREMSWGERSCTARKCKGAKYYTCNCDCPEYEWDGKTRPDSVKTEVHEYKPIIPQNKIANEGEIKVIGGVKYVVRKDGWRRI